MNMNWTFNSRAQYLNKSLHNRLNQCKGSDEILKWTDSFWDLATVIQQYRWRRDIRFSDSRARPFLKSENVIEVRKMPGLTGKHFAVLSFENVFPNVTVPEYAFHNEWACIHISWSCPTNTRCIRLLNNTIKYLTQSLLWYKLLHTRTITVKKVFQPTLLIVLSRIKKMNSQSKLTSSCMRLLCDLFSTKMVARVFARCHAVLCSVS